MIVAERTSIRLRQYRLRSPPRMCHPGSGQDRRADTADPSHMDTTDNQANGSPPQQR